MPTIRDKPAKAHLIERLNKLTGNEKPLWGKMTVNQMVSHLVQAGDMPFSATIADRSSFFSRSFIKPLILYVLPMPKDVRTSPEMNQQENGRRPLDLDVDKGLVIDSVNRISDLPVDHDCKYHPFFGKLNAKEWAVLAYKHIDHHLRQFGI